MEKEDLLELASEVVRTQREVVKGFAKVVGKIVFLECVKRQKDIKELIGEITDLSEKEIDAYVNDRANCSEEIIRTVGRALREKVAVPYLKEKGML